MLNIVIFGPPGSGKGTQSDKIIEKLGVAHISTGDVLRKEIRTGSKKGLEAQSYIDKGQLVPDALIISMLEKEYDLVSNRIGVIFDGFPRTPEQAKELKRMLNRRNTDVSIMLSLEVNEAELISRLLHRGETSGRSDDTLVTIEKRIKVYKEKTAPVIDFYDLENKHVSIEGSGNVEVISDRIFEAIEAL